MNEIQLENKENEINGNNVEDQIQPSMFNITFLNCSEFAEK